MHAPLRHAVHFVFVPVLLEKMGLADSNMGQCATVLFELATWTKAALKALAALPIIAVDTKTGATVVACHRAVREASNSYEKGISNCHVGARRDRETMWEGKSRRPCSLTGIIFWKRSHRRAE